MKSELQIEANLVKGSGGIFEVTVDGRVVAAKKLGQFPTDADVVAAVRTAIGSG